MDENLTYITARLRFLVGSVIAIGSARREKQDEGGEEEERIAISMTGTSERDGEECGDKQATRRKRRMRSFRCVKAEHSPTSFQRCICPRPRHSTLISPMVYTWLLEFGPQHRFMTHARSDAGSIVGNGVVVYRSDGGGLNVVSAARMKKQVPSFTLFVTPHVTNTLHRDSVQQSIS
jgi:hypothetical protein